MTTKSWWGAAVAVIFVIGCGPRQFGEQCGDNFGACGSGLACEWDRDFCDGSEVCNGNCVTACNAKPGASSCPAGCGCTGARSHGSALYCLPTSGGSAAACKW